MALNKEYLTKFTLMLPSVTELVGQKRKECEEFLTCHMSHDMYGGECDCQPLQLCWGHTHGKHWQPRSEEND